MKGSLWDAFNPIQVVVVATFALACLRLGVKNKTHRLVLFILGISVEHEMLSSLMIYEKNVSAWPYSVNFSVFMGLWLNVALKDARVWAKWPILAFFGIFALCNFSLFEGPAAFNYNTFIVGSLLYLTIFITLCLYRLQAENLSFFTSGYFVLISAPVLFFIGMCAIFGFRSHELAVTKLLGFPLYTLVNRASNLIYYLLLLLYLFKQKKTTHAS